MMPKLSVSVPDDLWEQAQSMAPGMGQSQLVQVALRRYIGVTGSRPFLRARSEENRALLRDALERVAERTQATYDQGYRAGLILAEGCPWALIEQLAEHEWDLEAWKSSFRDHYGQWNEPSEEDKFFWDCVEKASGPPYQHDATFRAGFTDGLGDLWRAFTGQEPNPQTRESQLMLDPDELPFE